MKRRLILLLIIGCLGAVTCKKTPNTTPRYNPEQCPLCTQMPGKCIYCAGAKACSFCDGTGKRWEGVGEKRYQVTCTFCLGTGKCSYCGGSGICPRCGGDGKWHYSGTGIPPAPGSSK
jgi:hypothetical protein